jgi:hypothetical protein
MFNLFKIFPSEKKSTNVNDLEIYIFENILSRRKRRRQRCGVKMPKMDTPAHNWFSIICPEIKTEYERIQ